MVINRPDRVRVRGLSPPTHHHHRQQGHPAAGPVPAQPARGVAGGAVGTHPSSAAVQVGWVCRLPLRSPGGSGRRGNGFPSAHRAGASGSACPAGALHGGAGCAPMGPTSPTTNPARPWRASRAQVRPLDPLPDQALQRSLEQLRARLPNLLARALARALQGALVRVLAWLVSVRILA
jgi:hypothetical protein